MKNDSTPKTVGFVVFHDFLLLDMAGPFDVFTRANALRATTGSLRYSLKVMSVVGGNIMVTSALPPPMDCEFDTVVVVGGPGVAHAKNDTSLLIWLNAMALRVRRIGSVCTGAYILAETGLFNGLPATTHWNHTAPFAAAYPKIRLCIDAMYVRNGKYFSSAGATAGLDLALNLVDEDYGRDLAMLVARELVIASVRPAGQTQFSAALASYATDSDRIRQATQFVLENLGTRVTVEDIAAHVSLSTRQLARKFKDALNMSPTTYIAKVRLDLARELISNTSQPIEKVALRCGFSGREQLKRIFKKHVGVSPEQFRHQFSKTSFPFNPELLL
jgi:transcriptional regulator GlxA family with amidase domain